MGKKQRERKQRKEEQKRPGVAPPGWASGEISPEARKIMQELGRGALFRNERQLFEIVSNSMMLRDEPEFEDFGFDVDEVTRIVSPMLEDKQEELDRAREISEDEYFAVYDELRLEAIDALLTRQHKREFLARYDKMLARLLAGTETDKITTALVTRTVFDEKGFPWGMAGIVLELFEEAREAVVDRIETVQNLVLSSLKKQHPDMTDEELASILDDPEQMEDAISQITPSPEQLSGLQEMADQILDDFERTLYSGTVPLDLFTEDEMQEVALRLNAITEAINQREGQTQTQEMEEVARMLQTYVGELMTPERQATLAADLTRIIGEWEQAGDLQSVLLEMERDSLPDVEPAQNQFTYAALVGQLRRATGEVEPETLVNAEGEPDSSIIDGTVIDSNGN